MDPQYTSRCPSLFSISVAPHNTPPITLNTSHIGQYMLNTFHLDIHTIHNTTYQSHYLVQFTQTAFFKYNTLDAEHTTNDALHAQNNILQPQYNTHKHIPVALSSSIPTGSTSAGAADEIEYSMGAPPELMGLWREV